MLTAKMLGTAELNWCGERLVFPFAKMEALLYYLLLKKSCSRSELAGLLWSDMSEEAAKKNLRNTLYMLKKIVNGDVIQMPSRSLLVLNEELCCDSDIDRLRQTAQWLEAYGGDFLAGFSCKDAVLFDEWVTRQRQELREEYVERLTRGAVALIKDKCYAQAKACLKRLILVDEYNESAYRSLMRIYGREDALNKAIEVYRQLEEKLQRELGIRPDAKTSDVLQTLQRRKADRPMPANMTMFYGREAQLQRIGDWLHRCRRPQEPRFLLLSGEQGVGKSALLSRSLELDGSDWPGIIVRTQCYPAETGYPYKAWSALFSQIVGELRRAAVKLPKEWLQVLQCVFPVLPTEDGAARLDFHALQSAVAQAVMLGVLDNLAARERVLLIVEDIHWMDEQGLDLLQQALRNQNRICCLATCRSEERTAFLRRLTENNAALLEELPLPRFTRDETASFAEAVLGKGGVSAALPDKLYQYTEGNALFLVESLKLLESGNDIGLLSPRLHSVLAERIGQLSDKGRRVIEALAVCIRDALYEELAEASGLNEFELVEAIEEAQERRLIEEKLQPGRQSLTYRFGHGCVRDFVYDQLSVSRRRLLHQRIGLLLERNLDAVAAQREMLYAAIHHFQEAGDEQKALECRIRLAERYSCPHYELFPELGAAAYSSVHDAQDRQRILEHMSELERRIEAAGGLRGSEEQTGRYLSAYLEMRGRYHIWLGEHRTGLRAIHRLLKLAAERGDIDYRIKGCLQVVYCAIQMRRPQLIEAFAEKMIRDAAKLRRETVLGTALRFKGVAQALCGETQEAERSYRQSIALFKRLNGGAAHAAHIAAAYNYIGDLRRGEGDWRAALQHHETAIRLHGRERTGEGLTIFYINAGYAAFELGEHDTARRYLDEALVVGEQFGGQLGYWCQRAHCTLNCVLARLAQRAGDTDGAQEELRKAEQFLEKYRDDNQAVLIAHTRREMEGASNER